MSLSGCFYPEHLAVILVYIFSSGGEHTTPHITLTLDLLLLLLG